MTTNSKKPPFPLHPPPALYKRKREKREYSRHGVDNPHDGFCQTPDPRATKVFFDSGDFMDYCGLIGGYESFRDLPIKPDDIIGRFYPHRIPDLLEFCDWFPEYSVISNYGKRGMINKMQLDAESFFLCHKMPHRERIVCKDLFHLRPAIWGGSTRPRELSLEEVVQVLRAQGYPDAKIIYPDEE